MGFDVSSTFYQLPVTLSLNMSKRLSAPVHRAALLGCHGLNDAALQTA